MSPERGTRPEQLEDALLEDSAEDLYQHAPCGYLSTLPDGTIVKVNETFLTWTGHAREEVVGQRRFSELLTAGGRIYHETHFAPLLRMQGAVRGIALEVVRADRSRLPVLVNSTLKRDADGSPLLIRTTVFDATDRKEYERELLRARDRERAERERTERLQRITAVLAGALAPGDVGEGIVGELVAGTGAARAVFATCDEEDRGLEVVTAWGYDPDGLRAWSRRATDAGSATAAALESGDPRFEGGSRGASAALPLVLRSRSHGILSLEFAEPREFSEADRAFMVACAGQCALALERAQLYGRTAETARRSAFHAEASRVLDEVQGVAERAQRLLDLVVRHVGGLAWLDLRTGEGLETIAVADRAGTPRDELLEGPRDWRLSDDAAAAADEVTVSGQPRVIHDAVARPPAPHSYVALPLRARAHVLGVLMLARFEGERRFRTADLPFLSELADRAALALENARLYEQERDVAQALQQSLLAGTPPQDPRFAVATMYRPAIQTLEVGGDWYDTFRTGEERIAVVVGDVVGRGIVAASAMGQLRSAVRALAAADLGPADVIERLDAFVAQITTARWATLAIAEIDLAGGRTRFASAGHPPPLLAEPGHPPRYLWEGRSPPVGAGGGDRPEAEVTLAPGARLLLYTDGLVERRTRSLDDGLDRLVEEFDRRRETPLHALVGDLADAMLAGQPHSDDVCLLCLAFGAAGASAR